MPLYKGKMILVPHQGEVCSGIGTIELACGGAKRHLLVQFEQTDDKEVPELLASADGKYGRGTSFMRLLHSEDFYVFVTSTSPEGSQIGESNLINGDITQECESYDLYLLNTLIPNVDLNFTLGKWHIKSIHTECAYDLTRVSLPNHEINLTHRLVLREENGKSFQWEQAKADVEKLLTFLGFVNCTYVSAPVIYGHKKRMFISFSFRPLSG